MSSARSLQGNEHKDQSRFEDEGQDEILCHSNIPLILSSVLLGGMLAHTSANKLMFPS